MTLHAFWRARAAAGALPRRCRAGRAAGAPSGLVLSTAGPSAALPHRAPGRVVWIPAGAGTGHVDRREVPLPVDWPLKDRPGKGKGRPPRRAAGLVRRVGLPGLS